MTLMRSISKLTTSVDQLAGEANVTKAQLDAKVAQADAEVVAAQAEQTATEAARDEAAAHTTDAATHLATVKADVTYEGIGAILAAKAVTAVDVFVYDTSLDSDGGAWRKRCQHTSWYNEELNTATRGARREFPAVAVIVAEATKLTIYDGDYPALPMWMVFGEGFNQMLGFTPSLGGSAPIVALNGRLAVGHTGYDLKCVDFIGDRAARAGNASIFGAHLGNISERNMGKNWATGASFLSLGPIINRGVNDVTMTVLPDAPIDPATRLPVPTIAVATEGGVSMIRDSGVVTNSQNTWSYRHVFFDEKRRYLYGVLGSGAFGLRVVDIAETGANGWGGSATQDFIPSANQQSGIPQFSSASFLRNCGVCSQRAAVVAGNRALALLDMPTASQNTDRTFLGAMLAEVNAKYTTGWMPAAIRGVFLADTDATALVAGANLVAGLFSPDREITGSGDWRAIISQASVNGGILTIFHDHASSPSGRVVSGVDLVEPGKAYRTMWTVDEFVGDANASQVNIGSDGSGNGGITSPSQNGVGTFEATFAVPPGWASRRVCLYALGGTPTGAVAGARFSAFSVEEISADRTVGANPLIVNGTITRSPVADGAELVAYSGFNDNNFLSRPYHSTLDFGTGDFCVIGWAKGGSLYDVILSYGDPASSGGLKISTDANLETIRLVVGNTTYTYGDGFRGANSGWWHFAVVRQSGVVSLYVNGRLNRSFSAPSSLNGNGANKLQIAKSNLPFPTNAGSDVWTGSLALLRISATAPTPDQIRKIYEDERKLFMPGAQCTLHGTSDAVTALAHDPKTNLLHVGTNQGRSVFDGLLRVANTETPVTTAISSVGGMIAEQ